jgi:hypothetical protein
VSGRLTILQLRQRDVAALPAGRGRVGGQAIERLTLPCLDLRQQGVGLAQVASVDRLSRIGLQRCNVRVVAGLS